MQSGSSLYKVFHTRLMTGIQQIHNSVFIDGKTFFSFEYVNAEQWVSGKRAEGLREWP